MRLAGSYHPIAYLISRMQEIIPGLNAVMGLYAESSGVIVLNIDGELVEVSELDRIKLQSLRNKRHSSHFWATDIDPLKQSNASGQTSLYDEQSLTTLYIPIPCQQGNSSLLDYIALSFPPTFAFSVDIKEFSALGSSEKFLLGKLLSSVVHAEVSRSVQESELLEEVRRVVKAQQQQIDDLKTHYEFMQQQYRNSIGIIAQQLLDTLESNYNKRFELTEAAIELLSKSNLSLEALQNCLEKAAMLTYHLIDGALSITIDAIHITIPSSTKSSVPVVTATSDKVLTLLDRYESAAEELRVSGQTVNGKNVAAALIPAITPAAISDAIRKNRRKISMLLEECPNRWNLIRLGLKGIERLDVSGQHLQRQG
jgi:hypothetical protein